MPYNSIIDRTGASALMPEEVMREIIQSVPQQSMVLRLARRLQNMSRKQTSMPVLSMLPYAYFVNGDTGLKQTTEVDWTNKTIDAEEIAVIVPIPEAVIDDADYDIWAEVRPLIEQAFGQVIDRAVLLGTDAPTSWPDDILTGATAAGNVVTEGALGDLYDDLMAEDGLLSKVEEDGFMVSGHVAHVRMRAKLRGLRDLQGQPIFRSNMQDATRFELDGSPLMFNMNNAFTAAQALMFSGDFNQLVYAFRQEITYKIIDQGVITNNATPPEIIYNLPQQDMVALRAVLRMGWQIPNPMNLMNDDADTRYPFAVYKPA